MVKFLVHHFLLYIPIQSYTYVNKLLKIFTSGCLVFGLHQSFKIR